MQVVTPPGLSEMQVAEATMAKAVGVRVVKLDCTQISLGYSGEKACEKALMATPAFAELLRAGARELPLTRNELLKLALQDGAPDEAARAHS
eukprot:COSAG03_NODE_14061_length_478_cov_1.213720_2_plen_91_part_01